MTDAQPVSEQQSQTLQVFANLIKFLKKAELLEKFELPDNRGFKLPENQKADSFLPFNTTIYKLSVTFMVWNIFIV